jgi:hypothetical protein
VLSVIVLGSIAYIVTDKTKVKGTPRSATTEPAG